MKTEMQVKVELKITKVKLMETVKRFEEHDNYEDMEEIARLEERIDVLEWFLM